MDIKEQLKDIKTQLRLSMNGAVSQSMREKGLLYKLNFGVELPRIKMIAEGYEKNHDLAQALWKENIRECKIMAAITRIGFSSTFSFVSASCALLGPFGPMSSSMCTVL